MNASAPREGCASQIHQWHLRVYVAGQTPCSINVMKNLRALCERHLPGRYRIEMVDLIEHPQAAREHQIIGLPTVVRCHPEPVRKVVGDLADTEKAITGLQLPVAESGSSL